MKKILFAAIVAAVISVSACESPERPQGKYTVYTDYASSFTSCLDADSIAPVGNGCTAVFASGICVTVCGTYTIRQNH